ncbi:3-deoxy-D-manno-octulosonic acid transferase [Phaeovulum sp. W22_SRMD_FR3]|uniref:3-deoxy-D-manno-octulosonic acid transferase n=1 Tax=Phaeovulum sp. W22_SRMD_FR3 TaxID=3240274 RepID=UPI003F99213F
MPIYRLLLSLAFPVLLLRLLLRRLRGQETAQALAERLGGSTLPRPQGPLIWLHGASNGEVTSARGLIEGLRQARPEATLLISTNTATARAMVMGWDLPGVIAVQAPLDHRGLLARFFAHWRPDLLVVIENEFWPNRLAMARAHGVPVVLVGARISARSARRWARLPGIAPAIRALSWVSPQDSASAAGFVALGVAADRIGPVLDLKAAAPLVPGPLPEDHARFAALLPRAKTVLAASTHPGEEEIVLEAFERARQTDPALRLILAPRHPDRGPRLAALIAAKGLPFTRRSAAEAPQQAVYLADTLGEMPLWYALAGVTFVGGSLVAKGGHTPFEPAAWHSALLHGPDDANFRAAYAALRAAAAAECVTDAPSLAAALTRLTADPALQASRAAAAHDALSALGQDLTPLVTRITQTLDRR